MSDYYKNTGDKRTLKLVHGKVGTIPKSIWVKRTDWTKVKVGECFRYVENPVTRTFSTAMLNEKRPDGWFQADKF